MVDMVEIDRRPGIAAGPSNGRALEAAENGDVLYLPHSAFAMTNREHGFLDPAIVKQPRRHSGRARIIYLEDLRDPGVIAASADCKFVCTGAV